VSQIKYQIFVSATYEDLKLEREQVIKAILDMGHFPVGMEMFGAADATQWRIISKTIEQSDYYVVICAHRYGSIEPDSNLSYTEKEYDYATKKKIPTLGFVIEKDAKWPSSFIDKDAAVVSALAVFKEKIKKKYVSTWKSTEDLYGKVSVALMKEINANPRTGWIRANLVPDASSLTELTRLSTENAALRKQIDEIAIQEKEQAREEITKVLAILNSNKLTLKFWFKNGSGWEGGVEVTLARIFNLLAPEMFIEKSLEDTARYLAQMISGKIPSELRDTWPTPNNTVRRFLSDLAALDLLCPSTRKHPAADTNEYWTLAPRGREILNHLKRQRLEAGLGASETMPAESVAKDKKGDVG
jgi:hypothetical protein